MIREDRELLAELARLNTAMASLALRIMDGSASLAEQQNYAQRLIAAGERLQQRANETNHPVIEGEVLTDVSIALPAQTAEPHRQSGDASTTTPDPAPGGRGGRSASAPSAYRTPLQVVGHEYPARDIQSDATNVHSRRGPRNGDRHASRPGFRRAGVGHLLRRVGDHGRDGRHRR